MRQPTPDGPKLIPAAQFALLLFRKRPGKELQGGGPRQAESRHSFQSPFFAKKALPQWGVSIALFLKTAEGIPHIRRQKQGDKRQ
jgi:hypothetical protein